MTPCKKCDNGDGISGYNIKIEYGWYGNGFPRVYSTIMYYGYACRCVSCDKWSSSSRTAKDAWENWERENAKYND